jgi:hypothetical protein
MPRLHYAREFGLAQIPIIRLITLNRADAQHHYGAPGPKAIAIHPWGLLFISSGKANSKEAQDSALSQCNNDPRRNFRDGPFLYAIDNQVVLPERRTTSK